ncbi:MAG: nucleotide sugar dehydrogenase [Candidatus ainarchaeum sp.]|nr:nucleotide sugar dehydrogenase [Candidatus ainarchaeum sp.]
MNITIIGLGYMGLPFALLLAKAGHKVTGYDINKKKIKLLNQGKLPFGELGLANLFEESKKTRNFIPTTELEKSDVFIVSVPTPEKNHHIDLTFVLNAVNTISKVLDHDNLIIIESTISPHCCKKIIKPILDKTGKKYGLVHCPERAIPGNTLYELVNNDRIIGGLDSASALRAKEIYSSFVKGKIFLTDITIAEVCKLTENTFRDINIAYANELAKICNDLGINVWEVIDLANKHPRVNILYPGPGVGGHCIAIDPWFLTEATKTSKIVPLAREINDAAPYFVVDKLQSVLNENNLHYNGAKILVLGLAYKANVDDDRESPAYKIIQLLKERKAEVKVYDPYLLDKSDFNNLKEGLAWAEIIILTTNHSNFVEQITKEKIKDQTIVFDTRNCLTGLKTHPFYYVL